MIDVHSLSHESCRFSPEGQPYDSLHSLQKTNNMRAEDFHQKVNHMTAVHAVHSLLKVNHMTAVHAVHSLLKVNHMTAVDFSFRIND